MTPPDPASLELHRDPDLFRDALQFTAARTGFAARLIEKDYFCTILLEYLADTEPELVFKGGTCLAKVHAGFYRLSEDLDFAISTAVTASRTERSRLAAGAKDAVARIPQSLSELRLARPLSGARDSSQYVATVAYSSLLGSGEESIKVEISLREPLLRQPIKAHARTLLLDPLTREPQKAAVPLACLSREEAMAEKLRAALSRRDAAIRDFFDVDHANRHQGWSLSDPTLIALVRAKLAIPGNERVDVSAARRDLLARQVASELRPVLRQQDFADFDLDRAFRSVEVFASALASST